MLNFSKLEIRNFHPFIVKQRSKSEMFFRMDLKPPFPDTPDNWEMILEAAFSSADEAGPTIHSDTTDN